MSIEEIANANINEVIDFLVDKSKNRFKNPIATAKIFQRAATDSYRLYKATIAASFNCIKALQKEVKTLDKVIKKSVKYLQTHEFECLCSICGIGPVFAAEIGDITIFNNQTNFHGLLGEKSNQVISQLRMPI